jgi:lipid II:glycine glycyltransferase (peptidoglycan interpeptide bridge formation enzyme)
MRALTQGFLTDVDGPLSHDWFGRVSSFKDVSLYQFWGLGDRERFVSTSRFTLTQSGELTAAAELRIFKIPLLRVGLAYSLWGPIVRRGEDQGAMECALQQAARGMRNEYVVGRGLVLRIKPRLAVGAGPWADLLRSEGFSPLEGATGGRTLIIDLSPDLDELRRGLDRKWRNCLNKAEKSGLTLHEGTGLDLFDEFSGLYQQMLVRKQFAPSADLDKHRGIQVSLPEAVKMRITIARLADGQPCAGAIYSAVGDTAVYLFGATNEAGMGLSASYIVQWAIVARLRAEGFSRYDLNGIDAIANPGTFHFKRGLAGRFGEEVELLGPFDAASNSLSARGLLLLERRRRNRGRSAS